MASRKRQVNWSLGDLVVVILLMYLFGGAYWLASAFLWHSPLSLGRTIFFCVCAVGMGVLVGDMRAIRRRELREHKSDDSSA